jgi:hypothetical protein
LRVGKAKALFMQVIPLTPGFSPVSQATQSLSRFNGFLGNAGQKPLKRL